MVCVRWFGVRDQMEGERKGRGSPDASQWLL